MCRAEVRGLSWLTKTLPLLPQGLHQGSLKTISVSAFEQLCCALLHAGSQAEALSTQLREEFSTALEFRGQPYPGPPGEGQAGVPQFLAIMEQLQTYKGPVRLVP